MAAEALLMLQTKPQPKRTFIIPVLKNTPVPLTEVPNVPLKRKRTQRAPPSSPIPLNKGRFAKKENLFKNTINKYLLHNLKYIIKNHEFDIKEVRYGLQNCITWGFRSW